MLILKAYEFYIKKRTKIKKLQLSLKKKSGRNSEGTIILKGRGGGFKRKYRIVDFTRSMELIPYYIVRFEYDPNRNTFLMLISYINGFVSYKIAPTLVRNGFLILNDFNFYTKKGSIIPLIESSTGSFIYNYQLKISAFSKYARSAGVFIQVVRKLGSYTLLRMPSGEERFVPIDSVSNLGRVSHNLVKLLKYTKAGKNRQKGFKSKVRGVAKNPIDHPHGGGEGRTTAGQPSVSPWGIYTKGVRTTSRFKRKGTYKQGFFKRRDKKVW